MGKVLIFRRNECVENVDTTVESGGKCPCIEKRDETTCYIDPKKCKNTLKKHNIEPSKRIYKDGVLKQIPNKYWGTIQKSNLKKNPVEKRRKKSGSFFTKCDDNKTKGKKHKKNKIKGKKKKHKNKRNYTKKSSK